MKFNLQKQNGLEQSKNEKSSTLPGWEKVGKKKKSEYGKKQSGHEIEKCQNRQYIGSIPSLGVATPRSNGWIT